MSWEADRLDECARQLRETANALRDEAGSLSAFVSDRVMHGLGSWHSVQAEALSHRTGERTAKLRNAADRLDTIAADASEQAEQKRREEHDRQRREQAPRHR